MSTHNFQKELQRFCELSRSGDRTLHVGENNILAVDTITESTSGSGVTIDSVLIKDNNVTAETATIGNALQGQCNITDFGNVNAPAFQATSSSFGYGIAAQGSVIQITNASTGVTLNFAAGQITTVALTTAAGAEERFTVSNSFMNAKNVVALSTTYAGAGTPMLSALKVAGGAFDIVITNVHAANALDAVMVINFAVFSLA